MRTPYSEVSRLRKAAGKVYSYRHVINEMPSFPPAPIRQPHRDGPMRPGHRLVLLQSLGLSKAEVRVHILRISIQVGILKPDRRG
jgi:hypothetical protein